MLHPEVNAVNPRQARLVQVGPACLQVCATQHNRTSMEGWCEINCNQIPEREVSYDVGCGHNRSYSYAEKFLEFESLDYHFGQGF
ncbi:hypothetical protein VNO80_10083 [Phaseolus coccineus]|uniref:Uncharacterized protein n=1 Tax=Phaseolus coccineus TaxID=3886 RepID=A0AAN9RD56_PHACN